MVEIWRGFRNPTSTVQSASRTSTRALLLKEHTHMCFVWSIVSLPWWLCHQSPTREIRRTANEHSTDSARKSRQLTILVALTMLLWRSTIFSSSSTQSRAVVDTSQLEESLITLCFSRLHRSSSSSPVCSSSVESRCCSSFLCSSYYSRDVGMSKSRFVLVFSPSPSFYNSCSSQRRVACFSSNYNAVLV